MKRKLKAAILLHSLTESSRWFESKAVHVSWAEVHVSVELGTGTDSLQSLTVWAYESVRSWRIVFYRLLMINIAEIESGMVIRAENTSVT